MNQPDIEIYIKHTNALEITSWLAAYFQPIETPLLTDENLALGTMIKGTLNETKVPLVITPKAAGKAFTSVWFQSEQTPWKNDLECAESFIAMHNREVRCSSGTWTEEEAENEEKWWCLSDGTKKLLRWG